MARSECRGCICVRGAAMRGVTIILLSGLSVLFAFGAADPTRAAQVHPQDGSKFYHVLPNTETSARTNCSVYQPGVFLAKLGFPTDDVAAHRDMEAFHKRRFERQRAAAASREFIPGRAVHPGQLTETRMYVGLRRHINVDKLDYVHCVGKVSAEFATALRDETHLPLALALLDDMRAPFDFLSDDIHVIAHQPNARWNRDISHGLPSVRTAVHIATDRH